ncbi:MAG: hypothetical protein AW07_01290 [Candidatus Accumulibacter sp. SK-11]|nr:MAG: hypothetical protein AW07_01290 [Candidatus Accumulibacter sp. SK-11]
MKVISPAGVQRRMMLFAFSTSSRYFISLASSARSDRLRSVMSLARTSSARRPS